MTKSLFNAVLENYIVTKSNEVLACAKNYNTDYTEANVKAHERLKSLFTYAKEKNDGHLRDLIEEYELWANAETGYAAAVAYKQGIKDGVQIKDEFQQFLNGTNEKLEVQ